MICHTCCICEKYKSIGCKVSGNSWNWYWKTNPHVPDLALYGFSTHLVFFSISSFGNILPNQQFIQSNCGLFNGFIISWAANIQTSIAADSIDAEIRSFYCTLKRMVSFSLFLTSRSIKPAIISRFVLYADDNAFINIIKQNIIHPQSRHLDIPVTFLYEKLQQKYSDIPKLNTADPSTKATSGPIHTRHWNFLRGVRLYLPS